MRETFTPKSKKYVDRVEKSFAKQGIMGLFGARLSSVLPGEVVLELDFSSDLTQQHGFLHAGVTTAMMDSAAGYAAYSLMPDDASVLTVEFKTNLLAPAKGEHFRFIGKVLKPGRIITFTEAEAIAIDANGHQKKIATLSATMMAVTGREDVKE